MKLYYVTGRTGWTGTQEAARSAAKDYGAFWDTFEIPTDKPGLIAWLNANSARPIAYQAEARADQLEAALAGDQVHKPLREDPMVPAPAERQAMRLAMGQCPACARTPAAADQAVKSADLDVMAEWIWTAEGWQVERLFANLGGRLAQLAREAGR